MIIVQNNKKWFLNPLLLIYAKIDDGDRFFCIENNSSEEYLKIIDKNIIILFFQLKQYRVFSENDFYSIFINYFDIDTSKSLFNFFVKNDFIVKKNKEKKPRYNNWLKHGWDEAFLWHFATKNYPFIDMSTSSAFDLDKNRMKKFAEKGEGSRHIYSF